MNENLAAKKGCSDLELAADAWAKYGEILTIEAHSRGESREFTDETWTEYAETIVSAAYARGRAEGLREALRILAREEA
jgi:hypothetical protein